MELTIKDKEIKIKIELDFTYNIKIGQMYQHNFYKFYRNEKIKNINKNNRSVSRKPYINMNNKERDVDRESENTYQELEKK